MASKRVFILGGYGSLAATHLIYHVGRVLEERFSYEPIVIRLVDIETYENSIFRLPKHYPTIDLPKLFETVRPEDILLPLAAASDLCLGLKLECRKLLYVQGANTCKVLDGFMDGYVSVSAFVQQTLRHFYGIDSPVINPFIDLDALPENPSWKDRDPGTVVIIPKAPPPVDVLLDAFAKRLFARHPNLRARFHVIERGIPHAELMGLLGRTRYIIALSPMEGFGLIPLEAMASGCTVVGFHGGGGLDYMTQENSRTVGYPRLDDLVDHFAEVFSNDSLAESIAARGMADAQRFTRGRFDTEWVRYLKVFGA